MKRTVMLVAASLGAFDGDCARAGPQRRADCFHRRHRQPGRHRRRQAGQVDVDERRGQDSSRSSMVTDHTGVNKSAVALVTKLKVTPEDNPTSQSLKSGGEQNVANLKTLKGADVRQGVHRPRGRLSPAGARRRRQDADSERAERGAEGAARQGPSGVRRAPRARQENPGVARQELIAS